MDKYEMKAQVLSTQKTLATGIKSNHTVKQKYKPSLDAKLSKIASEEQKISVKLIKVTPVQVLTITEKFNQLVQYKRNH